MNILNRIITKRECCVYVCNVMFAVFASWCSLSPFCMFTQMEIWKQMALALSHAEVWWLSWMYPSCFHLSLHLHILTNTAINGAKCTDLLGETSANRILKSVTYSEFHSNRWRKAFSNVTKCYNCWSLQAHILSHNTSVPKTWPFFLSLSWMCECFETDVDDVWPWPHAAEWQHR